MNQEQITKDFVGTFGYQSRRNNNLDENYGFTTKEEAIKYSMGFYNGWNTLIVKIVEKDNKIELEML